MMKGRKIVAVVSMLLVWMLSSISVFAAESYVVAGSSSNANGESTNLFGSDWSPDFEDNALSLVDEEKGVYAKTFENVEAGTTIKCKIVEDGLTKGWTMGGEYHYPVDGYETDSDGNAVIVMAETTNITFIYNESISKAQVVFGEFNLEEYLKANTQNTVHQPEETTPETTTPGIIYEVIGDEDTEDDATAETKAEVGTFQTIENQTEGNSGINNVTIIAIAISVLVIIALFVINVKNKPKR